MKYRYFYRDPHTQYLLVEAEAETRGAACLVLNLPAWRPGRYELGNFARNLRNLEVRDEQGRILNVTKTHLHTWEVITEGASEVRLSYQYFAAELNAGSTWIDPSQCYVNPINCTLYISGREEEPCTAEVMVPEHYEMACGLVSERIPGGYRFNATSFHLWVDSPFVASPNLHHNQFVMDGYEFHLWFQGGETPEWSRLLRDFFIFINEQLMLFGELPSETYHFIFQILPYPFHHGVEHVHSTVIALGPAHQTTTKSAYNELLSISSHELFHAWNVKTIRPTEMFPYRYQEPNLSRQGWVYEGITTYYGDYLLLRSGAFDEVDYFFQLAKQIQKHANNPGRFHATLAESSFDTWLDGYTKGAPGRKVSIYTEGCLFALVLDIAIRTGSNDGHTLDTVMKRLYTDFGKAGKGYSETDVMRLCSEAADHNLDAYFERYLYGTEPLLDAVREALAHIGLEVGMTPLENPYEGFLGIKVDATGARPVIADVWPESPAHTAGLAQGMIVVAVNSIEVGGNVHDWLNWTCQRPVSITISWMNEIKTFSVCPNQIMQYRKYHIFKSPEATSEERLRYQKWCGKHF